RVDAEGVLLGGSPMRYRATTVRVPWQDVESIVMWRQRVPHTSIQWVGVVRREGAPPLPGATSSPVPRALVHALAPVPYELVAASRAVSGWHLDRKRLAEAVAYFAPAVAVVEQH